MVRILVIDDDVVLCRLLREHFSEEGLEVTVASLSQEGLKMATQSPPDLILLDIMLPDETGYQTCGKLRRHLQTRGTPIIMMSHAGALPNQRALGQLMGANDFLPKPLNIIDLGDKVHELLGKAYPRRTPVTPHRAEPPQISVDEAFFEPIPAFSTQKINLLPASADLFDETDR